MKVPKSMKSVKEDSVVYRDDVMCMRVVLLMYLFYPNPPGPGARTTTTNNLPSTSTAMKDKMKETERGMNSVEEKM